MIPRPCVVVIAAVGVGATATPSALAGPNGKSDMVRPRGLLPSVPDAAIIDIAPTFVVLDSVAGRVRGGVVELRVAAGLSGLRAPVDVGVDVGVTVLSGYVDVPQPQDRQHPLCQRS